MKFAFSTVGCPDYQWSDVYSMAKDLGYDGIEVRGLGREFSTFNMQPFSEGEVGLTVKKLAELRLSIPCLSSGCVLKFADKREENLAQLKDYIHLAQKLNCLAAARADPAGGGMRRDAAAGNQRRVCRHRAPARFAHRSCVR